MLALRDALFDTEPQHERSPRAWGLNDNFTFVVLQAKIPVVSLEEEGKARRWFRETSDFDCC